MRRALRVALVAVTAAVLLIFCTVAGLFVALNTAGGRGFAVRAVNHFAGPGLQITGLGGHFPADLKLTCLTLADSQGVYATGTGLELRWTPLQLLRDDVHVSTLTAAKLDILRAPMPGKASKTAPALPALRLDVDRAAIASLHLAPALAGEEVTLRLQAAAHFADLAHGNLMLDAATLDGAAHYALSAAINSQTIALHAQLVEPPDGLLGHFAGPQLHAPLNVGLSLAGPRAQAALNFDAALGAARLHGSGILGLDPAHLAADVMLDVPELAPFAAFARQPVAGSSQLHLTVAQQAQGARLRIDGALDLRAAPDRLATLIGPSAKFSLLATLRGQVLDVQSLTLTGAAVAAALEGNISRAGFTLNTSLALSQVAGLLPGISGHVAESGTLNGIAQDFAIDTRLQGNIQDQKIPSGPFTLQLSARHLPSTPTGTLTGSGALAGAPLVLDAAFSRGPAGSWHLTVSHALWRSLEAQADLTLAGGAAIPTGTATFKLGRIEDLAALSPVPLRGSLVGDFAYPGAGIFRLDLDARNLLTDPRAGPVNATLHAVGPTNALAVQARFSLADLFSSPARLALTGMLNLDQHAASIATLAGSWHRLDFRLLAPVQLATQPGFSVRHLNATLNGARIGLDGTITPRLDANVTVQNLPASLAGLFAPALQASGSLCATAQLTGTVLAPAGTVTLAATGIKLESGLAAALPPADLNASATVTGATASLRAKLAAGPNLALSLDGQVPAHANGALDLHVTGRTDLTLLNPILAAQGTSIAGIAAADLTLTGSQTAPRVNGTLQLDGGSVENIASGLNLTAISARLAASGERVTLEQLRATAGAGEITGHGTLDLSHSGDPLDMTLNATNATPIASDLVTETADAALTLTGGLRSGLALAGSVKLTTANINLPKSLPPAVADLPILVAGARPAPRAAPPAPVALNLTVTAPNRIFVRGDGLFAEFSGKLRITGTAAAPVPEGGFTLIRGSFSLAGTTLQFTSGTIRFTGDGFAPTLDLEAATTTSTNTTATLIVGGTAAKPAITLTSSPPLPSDEILAQLLFNQSTSSLTPFQAASLAAALAQLSGLGGGVNPLDSVRNALGLDQLSLGGSGSGPPSLQAGRYIAPGVFASATQPANGQGTQVSVQVNLFRGLKLQTNTGSSNSVGLSYQFNY